MAVEQELENINRDKQAIFSLNVYCLEAQLMKLGDIVNITSGKAVNVVNRKGTKYPYYASNGNIGFIDEYTHDGEMVICAQDGTIGATHYYNGKIWASNHVWILKNKNYDIIKLTYLYLFMKYFVNYKFSITGNAMPKLTKFNAEKLIILVPPLEVQEEIVKKIEQAESETSHYAIYSKAIQKELDNISQMVKNLCLMDEINLKQFENNNNIYENDEDIEDYGDSQSLKSTDSDKLFTHEKKVSRTKKQIEPEFESDLDDDIPLKTTKTTKSTKSARLNGPKSKSETKTNYKSDTSLEDDEIQLEKLGISKMDLVKLKKSTKGWITHWFHEMTEKIFTNDVNGNWTIGKKYLYDTLENEIEEIKTKINKSLKERKKNKSTKSKVIFKEVNKEL